jgi:formate dehydrogenase iron-sulfur subunit
VELLDNLGAEGNMALTQELCDLMDTSSLCAMGGMTPIPVKSALKHWPQDFEKS